MRTHVTEPAHRPMQTFHEELLAMITPRTSWISTALLGSLAACTPAIDLEAERTALRATDEAWAAAASEGTDVELVASFWSEDATIYPNEAPVVRGKEAIIEFVRTSFDMPGFHVTWQPQEVVVAGSGDFGTTTGTNEFTVPGPDGALVVIPGHYVTVWSKNAEGDWKCVIDMFNSRAPATRAETP
jgi:ketosteroid isomerase-like protein